MKKVLVMFSALMLVGASVITAVATEPVDADKCDTGTTGLCMYVTTNGVKTASCHKGTNSANDCKAAVTQE